MRNLVFCLCLLLWIPGNNAPDNTPSDAVDIGTRLELFVDDFLIERLEGTTLRLQHPFPQETAIAFDKYWEGNTSAYVTVFPDGDIFRMYYRGSHWDPESDIYSEQVVCYAESNNGISWSKPQLGLYSYEGSKKNNIVWQGVGAHNFTPFKDTNPACPPEERYKAVGSEGDRLFAFKSADGLNWSLLEEEPILAGYAFDSQNLAFWDPLRGMYLEYHLGWRNKIRDILHSTSTDFRDWTAPEWLDWGTAPVEHLYTNAIRPYFRAPHILLGFPKRFLPARTTGRHKFEGLSDGLLMSSRDGIHWKKWGEAFLRPGPEPERWVNRNNMIAWGMLVTKSALPGSPDEISLYSNEGYYQKDCRMRRFTLRMDGFVSVHADASGGEMVTRPLRFSGRELIINYATSAAGSVQVEVQDEAGNPIEGFSLEDCPEIYGDEVERAVQWKQGTTLEELAGKPVRLRFVMKDADLYSLRFR
jgi:hypothetical protein